MTRRNTDLYLISLALICAFLWGSAFPVIKLVYGHWLDRGIEIDFTVRTLFASVRFIPAGIVLLILAKAPLRELSQTPLRWLAALSVTQTVGQYLFFYLGLALLSGSLASLLGSSGSFFWVLLAPLFLKKPFPNRKQWFWLVAATVGLGIAVYNPADVSPAPLLGTAAIFASCLCGALGMIAFQYLRPTMGSRAGTGFSLFFGGCLFALISHRGWHMLPQIFDLYTIMLTCWLIIVSATAFSIWNHLSTLYSPNLMASYRFMIPLCGMMESLLLLPGERMSLGLGIGAVIIVGSTWFMHRCTRFAEAVK